MPDPLSDLQRLGQEFDADVVTQADRDAAADIARIFLGNDDTLPDELKSGSLARHWLLSAVAAHRIAAIAAATPFIRQQALEEAAEACEQEGADPNWHHMFRMGCRSCSHAVREIATAIRSPGDRVV